MPPPPCQLLAAYFSFLSKSRLTRQLHHQSPPENLHGLSDFAVPEEQGLSLEHARHHAAGVPGVHRPVVRVTLLTQQDLWGTVAQVVGDLR